MRTWEIIKSGVSGSVANLDIFFAEYYQFYDEMELKITSIIPATDNVNLYMRVSADGSTFATGGSDYKQQIVYGLAAAAGGIGSTNAFIILGNALDNTATNQNIAKVEILSPSQSTLQPAFPITFDYLDNTPAYVTTKSVGLRASASVVQGLRFYFSSGNVASAKWRLMGLKY